MFCPKILLFTLEYFPYKGGLAQYLHGIASHYPKGKIVVLSDKPSIKDTGRPSFNHPVIYEQLLSTYLFPRWIKAIKILRQTIIKHNINYTIVANILPLGTVALINRLLTGKEYYVSLHGLDIGLAQKSLKKRWLTKRILKNAKGIIVNSFFTKRLVENFIGYRKRPIVIIYPCINKEEAQANKSKDELRRLYHYNHDQILLLSVGRLVKRKGVDLVIEILPDIIKKFHDVHYIIVGSGPKLKSLRSLVAKHQLESFATIITDATDDQLNDYYALSDIFVMPSRHIGSDVEGFGLVYLEAGRHKLPVIGTTTGGITEAIAHNRSGIVIPPDSKEELTKALTSLIKDREYRKELGNYGYIRAVEEFTWQQEVNTLLLWFNYI